MIKNEIIWHKAYLCHEGLQNLDFDKQDVQKFLNCLKEINDNQKL